MSKQTVIYKVGLQYMTPDVLQAMPMDELSISWRRLNSWYDDPTNTDQELKDKYIQAAKFIISELRERGFDVSVQTELTRLATESELSPSDNTANSQAKEEGVMIALMLPNDIATKMAVENGEKPDAMHITLAYLGKRSELPDDIMLRSTVAIQKTCDKHQSLIKGLAGGPEKFPPSDSSDGKEVIYATIDAPDLLLFRQQLVEELNAEGIEPYANFEYTPHITLAYVDEGSNDQVSVDPTMLSFNKVSLACGQSRFEFDLEKSAPTIPEISSDLADDIRLVEAITHALSLTKSDVDPKSANITKEIDASSRCNFCDMPANKALIWAGNSRYTYTCNGHIDHAMRHIMDQNREFINQVIDLTPEPAEQEPSNHTNGEDIHIHIHKEGKGMNYPKNSDLPESVRNALPDDAQTVFRTVANIKSKAGLSDERCMASAWSALEKQGFKKEGDKWIKVKKEFVEKEYTCSVFKSDGEKRLVTGIVMEPDAIDAHGDFTRAEEIERAAHKFLVQSRTVGLQHRKQAPCSVVESYITQSDGEMNNSPVRKGSWVMTVKVHDDKIWEGVKSGEFTGFSIGGLAIKS